MRGGSSAWRALGVVGVTWAVSTSCAGKSDRVDGDDATGGETGGASGASTNSGGSAGAQAGRAGTGGTGLTDGGAGTGGEPGGSMAGAGEGGDASGGAGTGGDPSGGAGTGGSAGRAPVAGVCDSPRSWSEDLEECAGGYVHRPVATACPVPVRDELVGGLDMNAGRENCSSCRVAPNQCTRDADCGNGAFCLRTEREDYDETIIGHWCQTPCATDGDCGAGFVCVCDRVVQNATRLETTLGICKPGTCRTDTDCGVGSFCVSPLNSPAESGRDAEPVLEAFHCQTSEHECFSSWQCPDAPDGEDCPPFSTCEESDGRFVCGFRYESIACSF